MKLVTYLQDRARVGVIEVPTESDAYVIFETLNDRGADLTIANLLKNYLYGKAQDKLEAVKKGLGACPWRVGVDRRGRQVRRLPAPLLEFA